MNTSRIIIMGSLGMVVALAVGVRQFRSAARVEGSMSSLRTSTDAIASADHQSTQALAKLDNVFFLPESDQSYASQSRSSSRRQPVANGSRRIGAGRAVTSRDEGEFISPRWSPDGLELMFSKPGYNGLYVKGADGGDMREVTDRDHVGFRAKWNADGTLDTVSNKGEKQSFNPDGTPADSVGSVDDASRVGAFTKDDQVYFRGSPGEPAVPVSSGDDRFYGGTLSPDGRYIAYNGLHTGLYISPLDGSGPGFCLGEGYSPAWLPDSSGIVYNISIDDGHNVIASDLYLASVNGQTISNLTQTPTRIELNPTVSPDGTMIAYELDGVIYVAPIY